MLEALGETLLARFETGLERSGAGFHRLRRVIRRQEETHHVFGMETLREAIVRGAADHASLRATSPPCRPSLRLPALRAPHDRMGGSDAHFRRARGDRQTQPSVLYPLTSATTASP